MIHADGSKLNAFDGGAAVMKSNGLMRRCNSEYVGGFKVASIFKRRMNGKLSRQWWASWKDHLGKPKTRSTGTADEAAARIVANDWEKDDMLCREGHREHVERLPIQSLLQRYELKLSAANNTQNYINETLRMIRAVFDQRAWKLAADIEPDSVVGYLAVLKDQGRAPRKLQKYIRALKGFTGWLVKTDKLPLDPPALKLIQLIAGCPCSLS